MEIIIITQNGQFIEALEKNTNLQKWTNNWINETGKYLDIEYWENGMIICGNDFIEISGDNGIIILEIQYKTI